MGFGWWRVCTLASWHFGMLAYWQVGTLVYGENSSYLNTHRRRSEVEAWSIVNRKSQSLIDFSQRRVSFEYAKSSVGISHFQRKSAGNSAKISRKGAGQDAGKDLENIELIFPAE